MLTSRTPHDEPESDDQGQYHEYGNNNNCTSSDSSRKSCSTHVTDNSCCSRTRIAFDDHPRYYEIDCDYSPAQIADLWFAKEEYDAFLKACDEDAQRCEARARVSAVRKELRTQKRTTTKETPKPKRLRTRNPTTTTGAAADDVDSEVPDMDEDILEDEDSKDTTGTAAASGEIHHNKDKDSDATCDLGLEAWTLDGYKTREHHRQKSIDAVINQQFAAWDRGVVENPELMSALYFAASAPSKHSSLQKARALEDDVREYLLVSALDDYSKAVQTLNVLQKSLHCIKSRHHVHTRRRNSKTDKKARATRHPITNETRHPQAPFSTDLDALVSTEASPNSGTKKLTSRSTTLKQRRASRTPKTMYKSKTGTNHFVVPPTPPVRQNRKIVYKPSMGGPPEVDRPRSTRTANSTKKKKTKTMRDPKRDEQQQQQRPKGDKPRTKSSPRPTSPGRLLKKMSRSAPNKSRTKTAPKKLKNSSREPSDSSPSSSSDRRTKKKDWWFQQQQKLSCQ